MFKLDGISSIELGVVALEEDFLTRAAIRYEEILIEGKDGSLINHNDFTNVVKQIKIQVVKTKNLDMIYKMFTGKRVLEFNGRVSNVLILEALETVRQANKKVFPCTFIRSPFWHMANDDYKNVVDVVENVGNWTAKPLIELSGSGKVDVTIGKVRFIYNFDSDGKVLIDCEQKTEMWNGMSKSKNIQIGFEYPVLSPGSNEVIVHSGITAIRIKRKDVWL